MSQAAPLPPNKSQAGLILGIEGTFYGLAALACVLRIHTRVWPRVVLAFEDYLLILALLFSSLQMSMEIVSVVLGSALHIQYVKPANIPKILALRQFMGFTWTWSLCFSKLSIATAMWRLMRHSRAWTWTLALASVLTIAIAIFAMYGQAAYCKPLSDAWEKLPNDPTRNCRSFSYTKTMIIISSVMYSVTDIFFSLIPLPLIMSLNRQRFEKIVIALLMAMGIFASIVSLVKLRFLSAFDKLTDPTWETVDFFIWSGVEGYVAIFAASVPQLKRLLQTTLNKIGLSVSIMTNQTRSEWETVGENTLPTETIQKTEDGNSLESIK